MAPQPILLDTESYDHPVGVQTWLEGTVSPALPETDKEWTNLVRHYVTIHALVPGAVDVPLLPAVLNASSVDACRELIQRQLALIPAAGLPAIVPSLLWSLERDATRHWPDPRTALCRVDANILNFVRRKDCWASVDWENSGWGDPAFEVAELLAHPTYIGISAARWAWVIATSCRLSDDESSALRIPVYYKTMIGWWLARLARVCHEIPQGLDHRLAARPERWQADLQAKYQHYARVADALLSS